MKKFALMVAAALAMSGLAGVGTAHASTPYPGTVATKCHVYTMKKKSHHAPLRPFFFVTSSSNAVPKGHVVVRVSGHYRKHHTTVHVSRTKRFGYNGNGAVRPMGHFHRGTYRVHATFKPSSGSIFKGCSVTSGKIRLT